MKNVKISLKVKSPFIAVYHRPKIVYICTFQRNNLKGKILLQFLKQLQSKFLFDCIFLFLVFSVGVIQKVSGHLTRRLNLSLDSIKCSDCSLSSFTRVNVLSKLPIFHIFNQNSCQEKELDLIELLLSFYFGGLSNIKKIVFLGFKKLKTLDNIPTFSI